RLGPKDSHYHPALSPPEATTLPVSSAREGVLSARAMTGDEEDRKGLDELRVLVVDDHDLFRTGLRNLLEEEGVNVVGEAENGETAIRLASDLTPDVIIMDLNMPGAGGVETTRRLSGLAPLSRVVVLTISADDEDVMNAVMAGACGYLLKDSSIQDLIVGIRAAAAGESLISPQIAAKLLRRLRSQSSSEEAAETIRAELSDREIEVLKLIANGNDNA